jgi:hypothetical protein
MTTISTLPTAPQRGQPAEEFNQNANTWVGALGTFTSQTNVVVGEVNSNATAIATNKTNSDISADICESAEQVALASGYKGNWSSLTGALNMPAVVSHSGFLWLLNVNLANVTTSTPSFTNNHWTVFTPWQINTITNRHVLSSSQSWVVPDGVFKIRIQYCGGGGSGGITLSNSEALSNIYAPGNGGEYKEMTLRVIPRTSLVITVGAGGVAVSGTTAKAGNDGASTTIVYNGTTYTALGGIGGSLIAQTADSRGGVGNGITARDGATLGEITFEYQGGDYFKTQRGGFNPMSGPAVSKWKCTNLNQAGLVGYAFGAGGTSGLTYNASVTSGAGSSGAVIIQYIQGDY